MINLLSKNDSKHSTDVYSKDMVKSMLQTVKNNKNKILETVGMEAAELYDDMEDAINTAKCNIKTHKATHAEGLVDIWRIFKKIPRLIDGSGVATRSQSLDSFIGAMQGIELKATSEIDDLTRQFKKVESRKMPKGEADRKYLNPGLHVNRLEFPLCPQCLTGMRPSHHFSQMMAAGRCLLVVEVYFTMDKLWKCMHPILL